MRADLPLLLVLALVLTTAAAQPPAYFDDEDDGGFEEYNDNELENLMNQKRSSLIYLYRRACVRRGGSCDHRPNDCCYNSTCRCNLWGANCRCQRKGIFQKWGK